jgi:hypothetical protein
MNAKWLIAKYIPDMKRREPRNIGVILLKDGKPYLRFRGRDKTDGKIDGNKTKFQKSVDNYRAWITYWEYAARKGDIQGLLGGARPDDNFILEFGGERIVGSELTEPENFADELFHQLVDSEEVYVEQRRESVKSVIEQVFNKLDISDKVERNQVLPGTADDDHIVFDFKYKNGKNTWMKHVSLGRSEKLVWEPLHSAAWAFDSAMKIDHGCQLVALVSNQDGEMDPRPVEFLSKHCGKVIDVSDEALADSGADGLRAVLGLDAVHA